MTSLSLLVLAAAILLPAPSWSCDELGELRRAQAQAQQQTAQARREAAARSRAQAAVDMDVLGELLELVYFPGLFEARTDAVEVAVRSDAAYQAVAARLSFLRGAPGSKIKLAAAERAAHIAALKADLLSSLTAAGDVLRGLDEDPRADRELAAIAEWGVESVIGLKDGAPVLTRAQRDAALRPAPSDPRE